jgi:long-chain fatty acid transport protein
MKLPIKHALVLAFAFALVFPATVFATNGMNMIGYGAKATGMGGAGVAYPQDAMAVAYNPASMTEVGQIRFDGTLELFNPPRAVRHVSSTLGQQSNDYTTDVASRNNLFPIPAIGVVMSDPVTPVALGMAIIGAGLGTNYSQSTVDASGNCIKNFYNPCITTVPYKQVGVFLMQMQMLPSIAYRVDEHNSFGASLVIAMQTFRAFGLEAFGDLGFSTSSTNLTNRGNDWSFGGGYRLGYFGTFFNKHLNFGFNYAPQVNMQKFNEYSGLFAGHGEFDIPESYTAGFALKIGEKSHIAFDYERINWATVRSIGNKGPNPYVPGDLNPNGICGVSPSNPNGLDSVSPSCSLGGDLGMGFGWNNQNVYKLGMDYQWSSTLTLRGGFNYAKSPIPSDQVLFNMLAPATTEKHITLGFTKTLDKDSDFTFTLMHAFRHTISGPTVFPPPGYVANGQQGDNASITMVQTSLSFAYGLKF